MICKVCIDRMDATWRDSKSGGGAMWWIEW